MLVSRKQKEERIQVISISPYQYLKGGRVVLVLRNARYSSSTPKTRQKANNKKVQ